MRLIQRLAIVLGAIVIFSGGLAATARAQAQTTSPGLQKAEQLEKTGKFQDVLNAYNQVVRDNQRHNAPLAAQALYESGLYASHYGANAQEKRQGQDQAVQLWRQLENEFPDTPAAQTARVPLGNLERDIDRRNSSDWKYQLINAMVVATGKNPNFSYGLALILLAVLVKLLLLPLTRRQYSGMREMQRMQPLIKELQKKYKGAELSQKQMELYKEHGVNPFASCLPTLLQMPFLFLVYYGIREYEFAFIHGKFLWIGSALSAQFPNIVAKNLASPDIPLLVLYTLTNYVTMRMTPATDPAQQQQQNTMALMTSAMFFYMFLIYKWSSAFVLYWFALNLISIWQQYVYVYKPHQERMRNGATVPGTAPVAPEAASGNGNGMGASSPVVEKALSAPQPTRVRPRKKRR